MQAIIDETPLESQVELEQKKSNIGSSVGLDIGYELYGQNPTQSSGNPFKIENYYLNKNNEKNSLDKNNERSSQSSFGKGDPYLTENDENPTQSSSELKFSTANDPNLLQPDRSTEFSMTNSYLNKINKINQDPIQSLNKSSEFSTKNYWNQLLENDPYYGLYDPSGFSPYGWFYEISEERVEQSKLELQTELNLTALETINEYINSRYEAFNKEYMSSSTLEENLEAKLYMGIELLRLTRERIEHTASQSNVRLSEVLIALRKLNPQLWSKIDEDIAKSYEIMQENYSQLQELDSSKAAKMEDDLFLMREWAKSVVEDENSLYKDIAEQILQELPEIQPYPQDKPSTVLFGYLLDMDEEGLQKTLDRLVEENPNLESFIQRKEDGKHDLEKTLIALSSPQAMELLDDTKEAQILRSLRNMNDSIEALSQILGNTEEIERWRKNYEEFVSKYKKGEFDKDLADELLKDSFKIILNNKEKIK